MPHTDLQRFLEQRMESVISSYFNSWSSQSEKPVHDLEEAVLEQATISNRGGKRLRAHLLLATYCAVKYPSTASVTFDQLPSELIDLACALELFQTSALVHDDIIDQAQLRRHEPSAYIALDNVYRSLASKTHESKSMAGQALGILLGDLLSTTACALANTSADKLPQSSAILTAFFRMMGEVDQGQVLDFGMEIMPLHDPEKLKRTALTTINKKTSSYTTIAPIDLGLLAAGKPPEIASNIASNIGTSLGLAYQLRDDLLDVTASSDDSGKPQCGDIYEGKRTVLLATALQRSDPDHKKRLIEIYQASQRTSEEVSYVRTDFHHTGAIDAVQKLIKDLASNSMSAIQDSCKTLNISKMGQERLADACSHFLF